MHKISSIWKMKKKRSEYVYKFSQVKHLFIIIYKDVRMSEFIALGFVVKLYRGCCFCVSANTCCKKQENYYLTNNLLKLVFNTF